MGHGALLISGYISWMSNHRPDLRETCWQVSSSSTYNSYNIVCTWLDLAMAMEMFCTIRVFIPYAYGTYHMRIRIWYNHTRMVRIIVPYAYGVCETPLVYIVSLLRP